MNTSKLTHDAETFALRVKHLSKAQVRFLRTLDRAGGSRNKPDGNRAAALSASAFVRNARACVLAGFVEAQNAFDFVRLTSDGRDLCATFNQWGWPE